jgi:hypothetical protein
LIIDALTVVDLKEESKKVKSLRDETDQQPSSFGRLLSSIPDKWINVKLHSLGAGSFKVGE